MLAEEWGFEPGRSYLDIKMKIVCTVHTVVDDNLIVLYGRQVEK